MSPRLRLALRALLIAAGIAITVAAALALRAADWPIYATFVLLSLVLFGPGVEVLPNMTLPMPGLALCIGFLYVGGLPIVLLRNVVPPFLTQLLHWIIPGRKRDVPANPGLGIPSVFWGGGRLFAARPLPSVERVAVAADWAAFNVGLAVRWWIASALVSGDRPAGHPAAMIVAEAGGYACWAVLSALPVLSFRTFLIEPAAEPLRDLYRDLGVVMILGLTPFVFLIAYGYAAHGLVGAAAWSLSALGLHFILRRLNERRVTVEDQNRRLETLDRELEHRERLSAIGKMSSVVSHQILQQLGVIGIHTDLIRHADGGEDAPRVVEHAAAIEDALAGVNRVMTDLLVFSRELRLNLYDHDLAQVLAECVAECRPAAAARGVILRLECRPAITARLDKLKIKQAVVNVVRNAIEASPAGGEVFVRGDLCDHEAEIAVSDRGPGVPEGERDAIFTPFFTKKQNGTGLGLAIAREFTEAHGGQISLERGDGGATFVLTLPRAGPIADAC